MTMFKALQISKTDDGQKLDWVELSEKDLMEGDVTVKVEKTTVNYKDGLAITGSSPVVRHWPMIPGIDFAGTVLSSQHDEFKKGDAVILNGFGVGETHWGAYSEVARVKGDWLIHKPENISAHDAMAVGTAGYTSMLCVLALEESGLTPDKGPILVTGANGGVGSVAIALLAKAGYEIIASTGRPEEEAFLKSLGAHQIIDRSELSEKGRPLGKERWAGAIDTVGSHSLANILAQTQYGGVVACCGLAQGFDLPTTVMPFILRGITLRGVDSVYASKEKRIKAWGRIAEDLDRNILASLTREIPLESVIQAGHDILDGKIRGRVVVNIS